MQCAAFCDPQNLIQLISELELEKHSTWRRAALICKSRSQEDPGRSRLWIVPTDARAGANAELWVKENREIFDEMVNQSVVQTSVVFAGALPAEIGRHRIEVHSRTEGRGVRHTVRGIRTLSAPLHVWVDRLKTFSERGDIDVKARKDRLHNWAAAKWTKEKEAVYVPPNLQVTAETPGKLGEAARECLLAKKPTPIEKGFVVIYGSGGAGKTFFLDRIGERLVSAAIQDLTSSIPVLVQLAGILHRDALENWLSRNGFGMLTLDQLGTLLRWGVIVPLLDALDEVVKGDARQGSDEFLDHIFAFARDEGKARGLLACRDYYLTTDRAVVRDRAQANMFPQLLIGSFTAQDTRRFLQVRTGLPPEHASKWAETLERQAMQVVGEESEWEVIRHPVVLDTLAEYITRLPAGSQVAAAEEFRLSRQDIFGNIVDELLKREQQKLTNLWRESFEGELHADWMNPFE